MAVFRKVARYLHGAVCGTTSDHPRAITHRGAAQGWSPSSAASHDRFLMSVDVERLPAHAVAVTLTVRSVPESCDEWARLVDNYYRRLSDKLPDGCSLLASHVTEMQKRRAPHLHIIAFSERPIPPSHYVDSWLHVARAYGPQRPSQCAKAATSVSGWLDYQQKHLSRGCNNVQRDRDSYPPEWLSVSRLGAAWGKRGDWSSVLVAPQVSVYSADDPDATALWHSERRKARKERLKSVKSALTATRERWRSSPLSSFYSHPRQALTDPALNLSRNQRALCSSFCSLSRLAQRLARIPKAIYPRVLSEPLTERDINRGWSREDKALAVSRAVGVSVRLWHYPHVDRSPTPRSAPSEPPFTADDFSDSSPFRVLFA